MYEFIGLEVYEFRSNQSLYPSLEDLVLRNLAQESFDGKNLFELRPFWRSEFIFALHTLS